MHLHISVHVSELEDAGVFPCVCVCDYMAERMKQKQKKKLIKDEKQKRNHVWILTYLREALCDSECMCSSDCLWSQKKRDLCFRSHAFFSRTHTSTGLNTSKMNWNSPLLGREGGRLVLIYAFIYFPKLMHSTPQTYTCCFVQQHDNLNVMGISLWLFSPCWYP